MNTKSKMYQLYDDCADEVCAKISEYAVDPERHFRRKHELPARTIIDYLVVLGGDNTKNELEAFFDRYANPVFDTGQDMEIVLYESSLVRQRKKLKPEALTDLFRSHARKVAERTPCSEMEHRHIDGTSFRYESSARYSDEKYHQSGPAGSADDGTWRQEATALYSVEKDLLLDVTVHGVKGKTGEPADLCELVDAGTFTKANRRSMLRTECTERITASRI